MKAKLVGIVTALVVVGGVLAATAYVRPDLLAKVGIPLGGGGKEDYGLFCDEHGVPEKFCTLCHPKLKETLLPCDEHGGLPEDICIKCHPENAKKYDIKPCEHGLPTHFCGQCHPENVQSVDGQAANSNMIDDGWCQAFGEKGGDGKTETCTLMPLVRLGSGELAEEIGLKTARAVEEEHFHELTANAETAYDANRFAEITPRVRGYIAEARKDLGQAVAAGEVLAVIDSSEVSTAKTQYLDAHAALQLADDTFRRMSKLVAENLVPTKEEIATRTAVNRAKTAVLDAEQRLKNFRFTAADLKTILDKTDTSSLLTIVSPIQGTIIQRHTVLGEAVEPIANLFTVADTSKLWLWIDVYERDVFQVREGELVTFNASAATKDPMMSTTGKITWVGADVNEKTRTTKVRAEIPNPDGKLRSGQYGKARIRIDDAHSALVVAKAAVQQFEGVDLVFLTQENATYRPQRIKTKPLNRPDVVEVAWGLKPGQEVVTDGSFLLKTELMKGSIGAGCCE